jgi:S1-C subfamily serine protease
MRKLKIILFVVGLAFLISGLYILEYPAKKLRMTLPPYRGAVPTLSATQLDMAKRETVLLSMEGIGEVGRCTGVVISPTHIVTAYHCMENSQYTNLLVYTYPLGTVYHGKPIFGAEGYDLALVEVDHPIKLHAYAKFSPTAPVGSAVTSIGQALGSMLWYVTHGIVATPYKIYLLSDILILPGNSGGPWFNLDGKVVGISDFTVASKRNERGLSGAVNGATVIKLLQILGN